MRYIKIFEEFDSFYKNPMFYIELILDDPDKLSEVINSGKNVVEMLNKKNINYRTYYCNKNNKNFNSDNDSLIFLFRELIVLPDDFVDDIEIEEVELEEIPELIEIIRIPDNDIDFYFNAMKYNL